jgi:Inner membrane protein YgaP-like, transmembrane domain
MSERIFRLILGGTLLLFLVYERVDLLYAYTGVVVFEGLTNWRIPMLISKVRYGSEFRDPSVGVAKIFKYKFDAERALRLVLAGFLVVSLVLFPKVLWLFPWFMGFALSLAGMTGICPMAIFIKKMGFR